MGTQSDAPVSSDRTGRSAVRIFRLSQRCGRAGAVFTNVLRFAFGIELPRQTRVGVPLDLPHGARGLVVHSRAVIGRGVTLHHNVTIGAREGGGAAPVLEDAVTVGPGAAVLGPITIGRGAVVGANAVVLIDVPAGAAAVGNPARIIQGDARRRTALSNAAAAVL